MIDPKAVRAHPDAMREAIRVRKVDPAKANVDRWLALDASAAEAATETSTRTTAKKSN